eukprot:403376849
MEFSNGSLGLDWFSFQTQIRKLVMELIEPTVKRTFEDHEIVHQLVTNYEKLKKRQEDFEFTTVKTLGRTASHDDLSKKFQEMSKFNESLQMEVTDMEKAIQTYKQDMHEALLREVQTLNYRNEDLNHKLQLTNENFQKQKVLLDNHNHQLLLTNVEVHKSLMKSEDMLGQAKDYVDKLIMESNREGELNLHDLKDNIAEEMRYNLKQFKIKFMKDFMGQDVNEKQIEAFNIPVEWITDPIDYLPIKRSKTQAIKSRQMIIIEQHKHRKSEAFLLENLNKYIGKDIMNLHNSQQQSKDLLPMNNIDLDDQRTQELNQMDRAINKQMSIKNFQVLQLDQQSLGMQRLQTAQNQEFNQQITKQQFSSYQQSFNGSKAGGQPLNELSNYNYQNQAKIDKQKKQIMSLEQIWAYVKQQMNFYFDNNQDVIFKLNRRIEFVKGIEQQFEDQEESQSNNKNFNLNAKPILPSKFGQLPQNSPKASILGAQNSLFNNSGLQFGKANTLNKLSLQNALNTPRNIQNSNTVVTPKNFTENMNNNNGLSSLQVQQEIGKLVQPLQEQIKILDEKLLQILNSKSQENTNINKLVSTQETAITSKQLDQISKQQEKLSKDQGNELKQLNAKILLLNEQIDQLKGDIAYRMQNQTVTFTEQIKESKAQCKVESLQQEQEQHEALEKRIQSQIMKLTEIITKILLDCTNIIKEQLKSYSENIKKELIYETSIVNKEMEAKNKEKFTQIEVHIQGLDDQILKLHNSNNQQESFNAITPKDKEFSNLRQSQNSTLIQPQNPENLTQKSTVLIENIVQDSLEQVQDVLKDTQDINTLELQNDEVVLQAELENQGDISQNDRVTNIEEQVSQLLLKFPSIEEQLSLLTPDNIIQFVKDLIEQLIPQSIIQDTHLQIKQFQQDMTDSIQFLEEKMKILENLESELERGVKRNARDKTDYLLQIRALSKQVEKQLQDFRDQLEEHQIQMDIVKSQTVDHLMSRSGDQKGEDQLNQLGLINIESNLHEPYYNEDVRQNTLNLDGDLVEPRQEDFNKYLTLKEQSNIATHSKNLTLNRDSGHFMKKDQHSLILPSVNKPSQVKLSASFQNKKGSKRVQSSEAVVDFSQNNSQINLASVRNLLAENADKSKYANYLANQKTKTLLNQNPIHNYSQILDPQEMLKQAKSKQLKQNISIDLGLSKGLNLNTSLINQSSNAIDKMPSIKNALKNSNQSNIQSIKQINAGVINWENVKIRDSNRATSQLQPHYKKIGSHLNMMHSEAALDDEELIQEFQQQQEVESKQQKAQAFEENINIPEIPEDHVPANPTVQYYMKKYSYEMMWGVVFVIAIFMFLRGRSANDNLAQEWKKACTQIISQNFAHFGVAKETSTSVEKISYNEYQYFASGRQNCHYALFKINLKKRHCLFTTVGMDIIWPSKDQVIVEIPISVPEYALSDGSSTTHVPLELVICRARDIKNFHTNFPYIKKFVAPFQVKSMSEAKQDSNSLVVYAESAEAANHIIDQQIGDVLSRLGPGNLAELHITDQKVYSSYPLMLRAVFNIESNPEKLQDIAKLTRAIIQMVDKCVSLRLTKDTRMKADKNRKEVDRLKAKERSEEDEEKLLQLKREEKKKWEEKLKALPPDQQRKMEEKKRAKDMLKQRQRMSKMVKK